MPQPVDPVFQATLKVRQHTGQQPINQRGSQVYGEDIEGAWGIRACAPCCHRVPAGKVVALDLDIPTYME